LCVRAAGRTQTCPAGPTAGEYGEGARKGSDLAVPACLVGWSEPGNQAKGGDLVTRQKTGRPGEITLAPGSGFDKGRSCTCWPKPDDPHPCTPQTCDWRCRACHIYGRPFYSRGDLQYLEQGTGPLAAELDRLWRVRGRASVALCERERAMPLTAGRRCRRKPLGWCHAVSTPAR
jgi:hypothetical protein